MRFANGKSLMDEKRKTIGLNLDTSRRRNNWANR